MTSYYVDDNSNGWKIIGYLVKEGKYPTTAFHKETNKAITIPTHYSMAQRTKLVKHLDIKWKL